MIDFGKIFKRSWLILRDYRTLWIFGILLALVTTGGGGGNFDINNVRNVTVPQEGWDLQNLPPTLRQLAEWFQKDVLPLFAHPEQHLATILWIVIAVVALALLLSALRAIVLYVSQTAVIRMADEYEQSGTKVGFRAGWRLGWNRRAFRLWLIDLILYVPPTLLFVAGLVAMTVLLSTLTSSSHDILAFYPYLYLAMILPLIILFVAVAVFLGLLRELCARAAVLDDRRALDSIRRGWEIFRKHWKSALLLWLIMIGFGIGFATISILAFVLFIPLYLLLLLPAALVSAIPGAIAFGIASLFTAGPLNWIIGLLFALPFFFTILFAPLIFLRGWYELYVFNVWTLAYREMKVGEVVPLNMTQESATSGE